MTRYLFSSHDGFGLGHVRRNAVIAAEILRLDPSAEVTLVTGVPSRPAWLNRAGLNVVSVPPLIKGSDGRYRNWRLSLPAALEVREEIFLREVRRREPEFVIVDRHPFGTAGELRLGLAAARRAGAHIALGLRDVIDERDVVRREIAGDGWHGMADVFDEVLVYGDPALCDHEQEYGLPLEPTYCGWVVEKPPAGAADPMLLVISAGGGGDGQAVFRLGLDVVRMRAGLRAVVAAGPFAASLPEQALDADRELAERVRLHRDGGATGALFARAGTVLLMAGYNSTAESLAAGLRPLLVPRRRPRREQAIRAARLACLGLADIVDESATAAEVSWLLDQPRRLPSGACAAAGISFDGAMVVGRRLAGSRIEGAA
jgi:predicted glycosyltransferase